jgi:hypothetical protein
MSLNSAVMSRFQSELRKEGMGDTTLDAHLGHLQAVLSCAAGNEHLRTRPQMHRPKRAKGQKFARGRALVAEEYERLLTACEAVRPHSGLAIDLSGKYPRLRIAGGSQKSGKDQLLPLVPDFARGCDGRRKVNGSAPCSAKALQCQYEHGLLRGYGRGRSRRQVSGRSTSPKRGQKRTV